MSVYVIECLHYACVCFTKTCISSSYFFVVFTTKSVFLFLFCVHKFLHSTAFPWQHTEHTMGHHEYIFLELLSLENHCIGFLWNLRRHLFKCTDRPWVYSDVNLFLCPLKTTYRLKNELPALNKASLQGCREERERGARGGLAAATDSTWVNDKFAAETERTWKKKCGKVQAWKRAQDKETQRRRDAGQSWWAQNELKEDRVWWNKSFHFRQQVATCIKGKASTAVSWEQKCIRSDGTDSEMIKRKE